MGGIRSRPEDQVQHQPLKPGPGGYHPTRGHLGSASGLSQSQLIHLKLQIKAYRLLDNQLPLSLKIFNAFRCCPGLNQSQLIQLTSQIMAYRMLDRQQPLSQEFFNTVKGRIPPRIFNLFQGRRMEPPAPVASTSSGPQVPPGRQVTIQKPAPVMPQYGKLVSNVPVNMLGRDPNIQYTLNTHSDHMVMEVKKVKKMPVMINNEIIWVDVVDKSSKFNFKGDILVTRSSANAMPPTPRGLPRLR